jgi:hypothetical protein
MSIDEVMKFVERVSHYDPARPQDLSRLRAAIDQHVAEEVAREREELLDLVDSYAKGNADLKDAIRARAEKETK